MRTRTRRRGGRGATVTILLIAIALAMLLIWYIGGQKTLITEPTSPIFAAFGIG